MSDLGIKLFEIFFSSLLAFISGVLLKLIADLKTERKERKEKAERESRERAEQKEAMLNSFNALKDCVNEIAIQFEEQRFETSRYRIIRYDDEMKQGIKHSDDHKEQIVEDVEKYDAYCESHPHFKNHKGQGARDRIMEHYNNGDLVW